jgi:uncharacterized protein (DUF3820 family)
MKFGKYKGVSIYDIPNEYLDWIYLNIKNLDYMIKLAIENKLGIQRSNEKKMGLK